MLGSGGLQTLSPPTNKSLVGNSPLVTLVQLHRHTSIPTSTRQHGVGGYQWNGTLYPIVGWGQYRDEVDKDPWQRKPLHLVCVAVLPLQGMRTNHNTSTTGLSSGKTRPGHGPTTSNTWWSGNQDKTVARPGRQDYSPDRLQQWYSAIWCGALFCRFRIIQGTFSKSWDASTPNIPSTEFMDHHTSLMGWNGIT